MAAATQLIGAAMFLISAGSGPDVKSPARERMVREQIEERGIRSTEVLRVMRATPRELFVPPQVREYAYRDSPLPIGFGATISQPYIVAAMTELLAPGKQHRVLEIGTGSGYQAAILAQLTAYVYTIEIVPELAQTARQRLRELGYGNVTVRTGDGYKGWPEKSPFDLIILTAAPAVVPQPLVDQLAIGGRLVAPVGGGGLQQLILMEKKKNGTIQKSAFGPVLFVPMRTESRGP